MICSNVTGLKYIGSTTAYSLAHRLSDQSSKCRMFYQFGTGSYATSFDVLKGGVGTYYIELIENFPCTSKDELSKRMGEIIRATECVNKLVTGRTVEEYRLECPEKHANHGRVIENQRKRRAYSAAVKELFAIQLD